MTMTWKEFKETVDKVLKEHDVSEDTAIWYIDITFPNSGDFEDGEIVMETDSFGISIN